MANITTRATKGSALTWTEGDANITNLNNDKIENVVEDTTPQLGGNLDVNGNSIVSTNNANINITPNGTGKIVLDGQQWPKGSTGGGSITGTVTDVDSVRIPNTITLSNFNGISMNDIITFTGTGVTSLGLSVGTEYKIWAPVGSGVFEIALNSGGGSVSITDPGTITDVNYSVATAGTSVTNGSVLTYTTGGQLTWNVPASAPSGIPSVSADSNPMLGGNLNVNNWSITSQNNGDINLTPNGTGKVVTPATLNANILASTQSSGDEGGQIELALAATNSVLTGSVAIDINQSQLRIFETGGSNRGVYINLANAGTGVSTNLLSGGGISDVVADTTPQLGGNLDVQSNTITTSVTDGNITLSPNSNGLLYVGNGTTTPIISSNGNYGLTLMTNGGFNTGSIFLAAGVNGNISISPNGTGKSKIYSLNYNEGAIYNLGSTGGTIAPNVTNGNVQQITLNSALTINGFTNPLPGQSLTLIIYGGTAYTSITSTMKFAGGIKTLTATAGCVDILTVYYDGTNYWASLGKDFK